MNDIFADMIDIIVIIYLDNILIYSDNISEHKLTFGSTPQTRTKDFLPMQTNANSTSLPVNTSDICCHQGLTMPRTKSRLSKIGQYHENQGYSSFLALPISTIASFMDIPKSRPTHASYPQGYPLHFSNECHSAFEAT